MSSGHPGRRKEDDGHSSRRWQNRLRARLSPSIPHALVFDFSLSLIRSFVCLAPFILKLSVVLARLEFSFFFIESVHVSEITWP